MTCDIFVQYLFSIYFHEYFMQENLRYAKVDYINNILNTIFSKKIANKTVVLCES